MSEGRKPFGAAFIAAPCAWEPCTGRLSGGWCDVCKSPSKYDDEGNECQRHFAEIGPVPEKALKKLIYMHTKLNPNQRDDQELIGYIVNAMRALERLHGIKA
jgi:hypothetical protein